jgi:hypothetical protein
MSQLVILDSNTLNVVDWYFADSPIVPVTPGITLEVVPPLTWDTVKGVRADDGTISLAEDPAKVAAKTQAQWTSVRAQQSDLLYKSDWTCSVIDPPAPILAQRDQWIAYRQALRDVTKQSDPFNIIWPTPPT